MDVPEDLTLENEAPSCVSSKETDVNSDQNVTRLYSCRESIPPSQGAMYGNQTSKANLHSQLRIFLGLDHRMRVTAFLRSACWGMLSVSLSNFLFLLQAAPHSYESWFVISVIVLPVIFIITPFAGIIHYWTCKRRNEVARRFFEQGLRVDGQGRLVTDTAHPQVVCDFSSFQKPPYSVPQSLHA